MDDFKTLDEWLENRPEVVKFLAAKLPPSHEYRINDTGQDCELHSYSEDGTVTVLTGDPFGLTSYRVHGLKPDDLEDLTTRANNPLTNRRA